MTRTRALVALLVGAAMGASETPHAQPRGQTSARDVRSSESQVEAPLVVLDESTRASRMAKMQTWLGRLAGEFRSEGRVAKPDATYEFHSTATCTHVGDGPGVRCFVGEQFSAFASQNEYNSSLGALPLLYFGINPDTLRIQLMLVDDIVVGGRSGALEGDTVDFSADDWKVCHTSPYGSCWVLATVTAKPAGDILMTFAADHWTHGRKLPVRTKSGHSIFIELRLRHASPVDAETPK